MLSMICFGILLVAETQVTAMTPSHAARVSAVTPAPTIHELQKRRGGGEHGGGGGGVVDGGGDGGAVYTATTTCGVIPYAIGV